jgi:hypothetical protein
MCNVDVLCRPRYGDFTVPGSREEVIALRDADFDPDHRLHLVDHVPTSADDGTCNPTHANPSVLHVFKRLFGYLVIPLQKSRIPYTSSEPPGLADAGARLRIYVALKAYIVNTHYLLSFDIPPPLTCQCLRPQHNMSNS